MVLSSAVGQVAARAVGRLAVAGLGLLLVSTVALAQTQPMPVLPPERPPAADPASPGAPTAPGLDSLGAVPSRPRAWDYGLGVGVGYDSNIEFLVPDGPSSIGIVPRANLARTFWSPRGELKLGATGYWTAYTEEQDLSRYDLTFSLDGTYRSSLSTTWRANGSYSFGTSWSSTVLADQGLLLPVVPTRTAAAGLGVTRSLGARTSFRLDGRALATTFDEDEGDAETLAFTDSGSIRGTAGLDRKLGLRDTIGLVYSLESAIYEAALTPGASRSSYLTHFGSLQWTHLFSNRSGFLIEAGGSYTPNAEEAGVGQPGNFYGGLSYNRMVKRSSLEMFARREVTPAFGLGVSRLENRFGLRASIPLGRAWTLGLSGTHVVPETPEGSAYAFSTPSEASATLGRRIGRIFEISAEGRYRRRGATDVSPTIEGYQAGLFLSLLSPAARPSSPTAGR
jgi:hypothetical protein